ncbi:MAG: DUF3035 domain-containing protein [Candidatus Puniceispirillaceae bacterium]
MVKDYTTSVRLLAGAAFALVALSGCSDFRQAIGSEKSTPDEFEVVVRPPLSLPPGFTERPDPNAQESQTIVSSAVVSAKGQTTLLLETRQTSVDGYDDLFAFDAVPDNIRELVDEETAGIQFERRLPIQIVFGGLPNVGPLLDQMEEDARLRTNRLNGKLPTEGVTKAIDGIDGSVILID